MRLESKGIRLLVLVMSACSLSGCLDFMGDEVAVTEVSDTIPDVNGAPKLSGSPLNSVKVGEAYNFKPNATDPDGDTLKFSIRNKPGWAEFDSKTGKISGMPLLGSEGMYENIRITASDGTATTSLEFDVKVTSIGTAAVTLAWTPPTTNEDGSAINNLAGYKIYYGRSSGNYTDEVRIDNPSVSVYVVDNLTPTTYYFSATAFNTSGIESDFTNELEIVVN